MLYSACEKQLEVTKMSLSRWLGEWLSFSCKLSPTKTQMLACTPLKTHKFALKINGFQMYFPMKIVPLLGDVRLFSGVSLSSDFNYRINFSRRISRILNFGLASFPLLVSMDQLWMMWAYKIQRCSHLWQCRHLAVFSLPNFGVIKWYSIGWNPYEAVEMDWNGIYQFLPSDLLIAQVEVTRKNQVFAYMGVSKNKGYPQIIHFTRGFPL